MKFPADSAQTVEPVSGKKTSFTVSHLAEIKPSASQPSLASSFYKQNKITGRLGANCRVCSREKNILEQFFSPCNNQTSS
jgi:hypothetical protein